LELAQSDNESSETIRNRVIAARAKAVHRFKHESWKLNSEIPPRALRQQFQPERAAMNFLHDELDKERITARGLHKILRTSWTIADLKGVDRPTLVEVEESYRLREGIE
jgi:magnesium chelatase family protein